MSTSTTTSLLSLGLGCVRWLSGILSMRISMPPAPGPWGSQCGQSPSHRSRRCFPDYFCWLSPWDTALFAPLSARRGLPLESCFSACSTLLPARPLSLSSIWGTSMTSLGKPSWCWSSRLFASTPASFSGFSRPCPKPWRNCRQFSLPFHLLD